MNHLYVGLISGTSIDCIDAVILDCSNALPKLIAFHEHAIDKTTKQAIAALCLPGDNEIDRMGAMDIQIGELFAEATRAVLVKANLKPEAITAIGSHGQTIRHRPPKENNSRGFTLQIGDANTIVELTGITTVADFRRRDMSAGGQGAPFAPAFHQGITPSDIETCAFINMGGIANITLIHQGKVLCGFDTGPANGLMDAWILKHKDLPFDDDGQWAKSGNMHSGLLAQLKSHPYFAQPSPKSTGREEFHLPWLESILAETKESIAAVDVQATLLRFSSETIADEINKQAHTPSVIYCCGGGARNGALLESLQSILTNTKVTTTDELGIPPDWIEACAFAWLAKQRLENKSITLSAVTGAKHECIAGAVYQ